MSESAGRVVAYEVGGWYRQQNGEWVQFVGVENEGSHYECMYSIDPEDGRRIHRYTRRDFGRITGSAHDYSDPRNTPPLVPEQLLVASEAIAAEHEKNWLAEGEKRIDLEIAIGKVRALADRMIADGYNGHGHARGPLYNFANKLIALTEKSEETR